jgi:O-acetyl-ADP-ribose deacetylase (regulator of RNase III)
MDLIKTLLKQPFSVIALILGVLLVVLPYIQIDKDYHLTTHIRTSVVPVAVGITLLVVAGLAFGFTLWTKHTTKGAGAGLDLTRVKEKDGALWTTVGGCEIRVVEGLLQDFACESGTAIVLPCNEYFDDECAGDTKSSLGAYVNRAFEGRVDEFISLVKNECRGKLGPAIPQQKTENARAESYGVGRCLLLLNPLRRSAPVALVSTTTQRAGQGLATQISYLFAGMRELVTKLADARLNEVAMPVLGAGHGRVDAPLALVGLLLAVAEAARYGQGSQRLRKVTIVVFKRDSHTPAQVDRTVVRRALALIGSSDASS